MPTTVDLWTPPAGMHSRTVTAWRTFYRRNLMEYGLKPEEYRLLYIAQKGRCWICRVAKGIHPDDPRGRGSRRLGVDHNHLTGQRRGLLCTGGDKTCNRIIGWLNNIQLRRAAEYLENPPGRVLDEMRNQVAIAEDAGVSLDRTEVAKLAVAYLWGDRDGE